MAQTALPRSTPVTGVRVTTLIVSWIAVVYLVASPLGLYYETLAAWYTVPVLALVYAYCVSHRTRRTAVLAGVATVVAVFILGFAIVIPKASAA
jgi:hypothetical protein